MCYTYLRGLLDGLRADEFQIRHMPRSPPDSIDGFWLCFCFCEGTTRVTRDGSSAQGRGEGRGSMVRLPRVVGRAGAACCFYIRKQKQKKEFIVIVCFLFSCGVCVGLVFCAPSNQILTKRDFCLGVWRGKYNFSCLRSFRNFFRENKGFLFIKQIFRVVLSQTFKILNKIFRKKH